MPTRSPLRELSQGPCSHDPVAHGSQAAPCVLVVEDDPHAQARLELLVEAAGLAAVCVASAAQARAALAAVFFPIVILDRMLEDGDGIALCADVRRRTAQGRIYLLLVSILDSAVDIAAGLAAGADVYLSKNASDQALLASLVTARHAISMPPK